MGDHHIIAGTEQNGFCDVCGLGGDLTFMSCKKTRQTTKIIERKIREED